MAARRAKARRVSPLYVSAAVRGLVEAEAERNGRTLTSETQRLLGEALALREARRAADDVRRAGEGVDKQA